MQKKIISTHTPHARRDQNLNIIEFTKMIFQLTRLMRGVTTHILLSFNRLMISTHTPHARRDENLVYLVATTILFQLTRLMRGVTTLSPRAPSTYAISTHTPHARRDDRLSRLDFLRKFISTHTPHARRDQQSDQSGCNMHLFQLTRLMRGVTERHDRV